MITLSIAIPCFGRQELLRSCLASIRTTDRGSIQVVLVDDGSSPPLDNVAEELLLTQDRFHKQRNRGRGAALREALLRCDGRFVLIMDSDDEFLPGAIDLILDDLAHLADAEAVQHCIGLVYECEDFDSGKPIERLPEKVVTNLLSLRADLGIAGDLKEVIDREEVLEALYPDPGQERRVPTSYIWAGTATKGVVLTRSVPVVRHRYLATGMTRNLGELKRKNPYWLARTYLRIAIAPRGVYQSSTYRFNRAVMALAMPGGRLSRAERGILRESLGRYLYSVAVTASWAYRVAKRMRG